MESQSSKSAEKMQKTSVKGKSRRNLHSGFLVIASWNCRSVLQTTNTLPGVVHGSYSHDSLLSTAFSVARAEAAMIDISRVASASEGVGTLVWLESIEAPGKSCQPAFGWSLEALLVLIPTSHHERRNHSATFTRPRRYTD